MAEAFLHLNGHTYDLASGYVSDDGRALEQLRGNLDALVASPQTAPPLQVMVRLRGDVVALRIAPAGVQSVGVGVTVY